MDEDQDLELCPHCKTWLSHRQVNRHLEQVVRDFNLSSSDEEMSDDGDADAEMSENNDADTDNDDAPALNLPALDLPPDLPALGVPNAIDDLGPTNNPDTGDYPGSGNEPDDEEPPQLPVGMAPAGVDPAVLPLLAPLYWLLRNPAVNIDAWPEPTDSEQSSAEDEPVEENPVNGEQDPEFVERIAPLEADAIDEPEVGDNELPAFLQAHLLDMNEEEWLDLYARVLSKRDRKTLELLATRLRTHFSRTTWDELRLGICEEHKIPSEFIAWRRLRILAGLDTRTYDCCIGSCCAFLGKYAALDKCPFCDEKRYTSKGAARRRFCYTPLIPQLRSLFQCTTMAKNLRYRVASERDYEPGVIEDVFDAENYRQLRKKVVEESGGYKFFDNPEDIALGLSTDGFTLFKRRRRGLSTAWPIIILNYNLDPKIRTRLENVLCVGVIPGPRQCKDLNSYLAPLLDELLELEHGIVCSGLKPE
ncbi:hypothetical protein FRC06_008116, partial [Ceratobasidium sp. 370]